MSTTRFIQLAIMIAIQVCIFLAYMDQAMINLQERHQHRHARIQTPYWGSSVLTTIRFSLKRMIVARKKSTMALIFHTMATTSWFVR